MTLKTLEQRVKNCEMLRDLLKNKLNEVEEDLSKYSAEYKRRYQEEEAGQKTFFTKEDYTPLDF